MLNLTFGEQVKIILSRKGMTIKELAETIEERTGKKMSRQNLTQRLGRDNFQEQDMRMIAEILECPFQLSILADYDAVERASNISDVEPTEKELSRLSKSRSRKEKKAKEIEMTLEDYMEIHEALEQQEAEPEAVPEMEAAAPEPALETVPEAVSEMEEAELEAVAAAVEQIADQVEEEEPEEMEYAEELVDPEEAIRELAEIEREEAERQDHVAEETHEESRRSGGWRAMFQRRTRKESREEAAATHSVTEEPAQQPEEFSVPQQEAAMAPETGLYEEIEAVEVDEEAEDLIRGDLNPQTGHEYESNTVRTHPKRIGYVQVYDRKDHAWTDMTEWAFLGYQERKKALLGKDYESPIYLD